jgi:glycosyltransferase involved in cell wall biosynthesis
LKEEKIDIINTYLTKCSLYFALANVFHRKPICCTLLNAITHERLNSAKKAVFPCLYYFLEKISDGIIVNSEGNKRHFMEVAKMSGKSVKVIYSGIDVSDFWGGGVPQKQKGKFTIGAVGRLSVEKGFVHLVEALRYLQSIDFECVIIGDGPQRRDLEDKVRAFGLEGKVRFLGFQDRVAELMALMDVVIVPSLNETFGITIIEAFAMRRPVIASDAGGIPELVRPGQTGLLFPVRDSQMLARQIVYVYENPAEASRMAERGNEFVLANFTSSAMAEQTIDYYHSILRKRGM